MGTSRNIPRHESVYQVKSSQGLLFSEANKPYTKTVGQTGAQGLVRGCGPHCPPVSRKNPARDEASGAVKEKTRHPRWFFFFQGTFKKNRRLAASHFTDTNTNEPHVAAFSSFASPFLLLLFLSPHPPAGQEPKVLNDPRVPAFYSFAPPPSFFFLFFFFSPPAHPHVRRPGQRHCGTFYLQQLYQLHQL